MKRKISKQNYGRNKESLRENVSAATKTLLLCSELQTPDMSILFS